MAALVLAGCTSDPKPPAFPKDAATGEGQGDPADAGPPAPAPDAEGPECSFDLPCPASASACQANACRDGRCVLEPQQDGTGCDDGLTCTVEDRCTAGACGGQPRVCDDGIFCSADSCNEAMGGCVADVSTCSCQTDGDCDDGNACNGVEVCNLDINRCAPGNKVDCAVLDDACNVGQCNAQNGTCRAVPRADGTRCDDKNLCTRSDVCQAGLCVGKDPLVCTAKDQCHGAGACNPQTGMCSTPRKPDGVGCDDGNLCTAGETCAAGVCGGGTSRTCVASDECHDPGECNPATGSCSNPAKPNGTSCNDGLSCTNNDVCQGGSCTGAARPCNDGIACTQDSCSEDFNGCVTDPSTCGCQQDSDCDDGNACNGSETCNPQTLTCRKGTAVDCSGMNGACQVGTCNPSSGQCYAVARPDGTSCDDGNACTKADSCQKGSCAGNDPVVCTASDQCHAAGVCNPQTGMCSNPNKADGSSCDDGNACTQVDVCGGGTCRGTEPVVCTASDQCHTAGTCDPGTGTCSDPVKPNGTTCDDGNACTRTDTCQAGGCSGSNAVVCTASDQCHTAGVCDVATGLCSNPSKPDDTSCNDGNACTRADVCRSGQCTGNNPVVCTAMDQCHTAGTCDPGTGTCSNPAQPDDTACDDMNACTRSDACQAGVCTGANPVVCMASDQCHDAGACNPATGTCSNPAKPDNTACSDGKACTTNDVCAAGLCAGVEKSCSDGIACTQDSCSEAQAGACVYDTSKCGCTQDIDCNDGNACNGAETCNLQTLTCTPGMPVVCNQLDDQCNTGTCNPSTGQCQASPLPNGSQCSDGSLCTQTDTCQSGACVGTNPVVCSASGQCRDIGTCDPGTGTCSNPAKNNGTPCSDGNACTQSDTCQNGACSPGTAKTCIASDQCHLPGTCDPANGNCTDPAKNNGEACNDGNACTQGDVCQSGVCNSGQAVRCTAAGPCRGIGTCDVKTGTCSDPPLDDGTMCDDGSFCTRTDTCQNGACVGSGNVTCNTPGVCQSGGTCNPTNGTCSYQTAADGSQCNDGSNCTQADQCTSGSCGGTAVVCTPGQCQQSGSCQQDGTCAFVNKPDRTSCNDGSNCTSIDLCNAGSCIGTKRANKGNDWNTTPSLEGSLTSVHMATRKDGAIAVAGAYTGKVFFDDSMDTGAGPGEVGAYLAVYDETVKENVLLAETAIIARQLEKQGGQLDVRGMAVTPDGGYVLIGLMVGDVTFGVGAEFNVKSGAALGFVASFDGQGKAAWVRIFASARGVLPQAVSVFGDGNVMVSGWFSEDVTVYDHTGKSFDQGVSGSGTFAAYFDSGGGYGWTSWIADETLGRIDMAADDESHFAGFVATYTGSVQLRDAEGKHRDLGAAGGDKDQDVVVFALDDQARLRWGFSVGGSQTDEVGGIAARKGFPVLVSVRGADGKITDGETSSGLHGISETTLHAHLIAFDPDGTPRGAALIADKESDVGAHDLAVDTGSGELTALGWFGRSASTYGNVGFGSGAPSAPSELTIDSSHRTGNGLFAARFQYVEKTKWAVELRGNSAGIRTGGSDWDAQVIVHPSEAASAAGMFSVAATFGDQVVDTLTPGAQSGSFFLSHFNSQAEYDHCQ